MKSLSFRSSLFFALAALLAIVGLTRAVSADSHANVVVFNTPVGADAPGPLLPGHSYSATFSAEKGETLSFATMLVQSNDWFFAPNQWGIALYDRQGNPRTGDITRFVHLLDAGTEVDQTPGSGADQAPRQAGPNTGAADANNTVRFVHGGVVPPVNQLIRATLSYASGQFTLNIANVSGNSTFGTPLAPGVVVLHRGQSPLFAVGQPDRGQGLEALAEDGNPAILAGNLTNNAPAGNNSAPAAPAAPAPAPAPATGSSKLAVFAVPTGSDGPGPLLPGHSYQFTVNADKGDYLHFATMFVQSNDWFFSPSQRGIKLYNADGTAKTGDITPYIRLYDSGTEIDQTAGSGADQAPRQAGPNTGAADPNNRVRRAHDDSGQVPGVDKLIKATLDYANGAFTVTIMNISGDSFATPLAPGVGLATSTYAPIFKSGFGDRGQGLEALAEDGNPAILAESLGGTTAPAPASTAPTAPAPAANVAKSAVFAVPVGADGPGPLLPGHSYEFSVSANKGDYLHFATMFVQSNDWFFSPSQRGIKLYNADGTAKTGDITGYVHLYDAGTEIDQTPGVGHYQAPRQPGPNSGPADLNTRVRRAHDDSGMVPSVDKLIKVTLSYDGSGVFTVNIANISNGSSFATPLAPGVGLATGTYAPIFKSGFADRGYGLEALAEDGNPAILADNLMK